MSIRLLMSACLLGHCCRWDAKNGTSCVNRELHRMLSGGEVAAICPECAGGLPVPRPASEIEPGGSAREVLARRARVINTAGDDVSAAFVAGAHKALELVEKHGIGVAILKSKSPSCGNAQVYDGSFSGRLTAGSGVTAELLMAHGVRVFDERHVAEALEALTQASCDRP